MNNTSNEWRPAPIIYINAFPGTGELAIAKHLLTLFRADTTRLVHNRLLTNPADAVLERHQPGYLTLRCDIRRTVFHSLTQNPATLSCAYIFTDFQSAHRLGHKASLEYFKCAEQRGCDFIPITLICDKEKNLKRLVTSAGSAYTELVEALRDSCKLVDFAEWNAAWKLDVTDLSAEEAAAEILGHLVKVSPAMAARRVEQPSDKGAVEEADKGRKALRLEVCQE